MSDDLGDPRMVILVFRSFSEFHRQQIDVEIDELTDLDI